MQIIHTKDKKEGISSLGNTIGNALKEGRNVLWVLSGGSNISIAVEVMNMLQNFVAKKDLERLTITLSDERYDDLGHKDSNWQQLIDAGLNISNINTIPVLLGLDFEKTKDDFSVKVKKAYNKADIIIGQLGIGTDGHIAGILPSSRGIDDTSVAVAYEANDYKRITLTLKMIKKISVVFLFAFGESKKSIIRGLTSRSDLATNEMPAQILKKMKDVRVYCD